MSLRIPLLLPHRRSLEPKDKALFTFQYFDVLAYKPRTLLEGPGLLSQLGSLEPKAKSKIASRHSLLEGPDSAVSARKPRTQSQKHLPLVIV